MMRLRVLAFTNILRQAVGWFDDKDSSPGCLTTKLARDAPVVKAVRAIFSWNHMPVRARTNYYNFVLCLFLVGRWHASRPSDVGNCDHYYGRVHSVHLRMETSFSAGARRAFYNWRWIPTANESQEEPAQGREIYGRSGPSNKLMLYIHSRSRVAFDKLHKRSRCISMKKYNFR